MNYEPELLSTFIKMIIILAVIIGGFWGLSWFSKKKMGFHGSSISGRKIEIIENCHLGVKKTISLVQVPGAVLVIGITDNQMTLLYEVKEYETKKI
jgi:flagellar protein FliO/FliZ